MRTAERTRMEAALKQYYAHQVEAPSDDELSRIAQAMLAEDSRTHRVQAPSMSLPAFVAAQVRFIPAWTWVAQVALVAVMVAVAAASQGTAMEAPQLLVGVLSIASVLVGVPTVAASKRCSVAELEYACVHNAASVMVARLIVLGCSSALVVALLVGVAAQSLNVGVFTVALWACPPFFFTCAGSLALLRKAQPAIATTLCMVWALACVFVLLGCATIFPNLYAAASLAVWAGAAAIAFVWLAREVACTYRAAAAGLDAFSPYLAKTYN